MATKLRTLIRTEGEAPREQSTCRWRDGLISREDPNVPARVHAVDIEGAREHYHKLGTEFDDVVEGEREVVLYGDSFSVRKGPVVHIPPRVVHSAMRGAKGEMRVLVVGIPDIANDNLFNPDQRG